MVGRHSDGEKCGGQTPPSKFGGKTPIGDVHNDPASSLIDNPAETDLEKVACMAHIGTFSQLVFA